ncbi:MAG: 8-amino-7-oxononanoate synthase, partial [Janthinobacterium sp.]
MLDFTSALYLGMRHPADRLAPWESLSLGKPAALREPPGAQALAADLAALQGCEAACLLPSTLHLFWDLFGMLAGERLVILADGASYAIARWGAERAQALGLPLQVFPSGEVALLRRLAAGWRHRTGRRPLILADGYVPGSDRAPPLAAYAAIAQQGGGHVLLDDTQVLGVSGAQGGGSARLHGLQGEALIIGASLAKGFGVPLAVLAGSHGLLRRFMAHSQT